MTLFDKGEAEREMAQEAETLAAATTATPQEGGGAEEAAEPEAPPAGEAGAASGEAADSAVAEAATEGAGRSVPFNALKAERQKRQQAERDLHTLQGQVKAWQNAMLAQLQGSAGEAAAKTPPDAEADPLGALRYTQQQLGELQAAVAAQVRGQQLQQAYVAGAASFSREHPDFADAYSHMIQSRANELRVLGAPEPAIAQQLRLEEQQMVAAAVGAGRNPAEIAYAAAQARGWQPKAGRPAGEAPPLPAANRAQAAVSLSPGGRANREALSAEDLARLSGRDFDAGWDKLFGRRGGGTMFAGR